MHEPEDHDHRADPEDPADELVHRLDTLACRDDAAPPTLGRRRRRLRALAIGAELARARAPFEISSAAENSPAHTSRPREHAVASGGLDTVHHRRRRDDADELLAAAVHAGPPESPGQISAFAVKWPGATESTFSDSARTQVDGLGAELRPECFCSWSPASSRVQLEVREARSGRSRGCGPRRSAWAARRCGPAPSACRPGGARARGSGDVPVALRVATLGSDDRPHLHLRPREVFAAELDLDVFRRHVGPQHAPFASRFVTQWWAVSHAIVGDERPGAGDVATRDEAHDGVRAETSPRRASGVGDPQPRGAPRGSVARLLDAEDTRHNPSRRATTSPPLVRRPAIPRAFGPGVLSRDRCLRPKGYEIWRTTREFKAKRAG